MDTEIIDETHLGPFHHPDKLSVGDTQSMQFGTNDSDPFYLSRAEEKKKFDKNSSEKETKKYTWSIDQKD